MNEDTLNIDDDILKRLKDYAKDRSLALYKAASDLNGEWFPYRRSPSKESKSC